MLCSVVLITKKSPVSYKEIFWRAGSGPRASHLKRPAAGTGSDGAMSPHSVSRSTVCFIAPLSGARALLKIQSHNVI